MDRVDKNTKDYYVVDIAHIAMTIWHRIWAVIFASILASVVGFSVAAFVITPTYSSSAMLYVNNGTQLEELGFSISSSELTAAQSLAKTYTVLLKNRTTLEKVLEKSGLTKYDWEDVDEMIECGPVNETEVLRITVTCESAEDSYRLAKAITQVFPNVVSDINKADLKVVDRPILDKEKVAPSIAAYTAVGFMVGALVSVLVLIVMALMDNTVHDEDYVIKNYGYPILAKIPSLGNSGAKRHNRQK